MPTGTTIGFPKKIPPPIDQSCVGYWKLDETSGNIKDWSGNGNTGTPWNSPTYSVTGKFGKSLSFNGINQAVACGNSIAPVNTITVIGWVYLKSGGNNHFDSSPITKGWPYFALGWYNSTTPAQNAHLQTSVNGLVNIIGNEIASLDTWYHSCLTYDGSNIKLYLNGKQTAIQAATGTLVYSADVWLIAANSYGGYDYSNIDEVRIYNRALSLQEIKRHYMAGR